MAIKDGSDYQRITELGEKHKISSRACRAMRRTFFDVISKLDIGIKRNYEGAAYSPYENVLGALDSRSGEKAILVTILGKESRCREFIRERLYGDNLDKPSEAMSDIGKHTEEAIETLRSFFEERDNNRPNCVEKKNTQNCRNSELIEL